METDVPQLRMTKESLVRGRLRSFTPKYRRTLALDLLLKGRTGIPGRWLTRQQQDFLALEASAVLSAGTREGALQMVEQVVRLCDELVPSLIDDFLREQPADTVDTVERADLRRRGGPPAVCAAIFQACSSWPQAEARHLPAPAREAVRKALHATLERRRSRRQAAAVDPGGGPVAGVGTERVSLTPADQRRLPVDVAPLTRLLQWFSTPADGAGADPGLVLRANRRPADDRDLTDRLTTHATSSDAALRRHVVLETVRDARDMVKAFISAFTAASTAGSLAVLWVALFLALRRFAPELTVEQDMKVVSMAVGFAAGSGIVGQVVKARLRRGKDGGRPPA